MRLRTTWVVIEALAFFSWVLNCTSPGVELFPMVYLPAGMVLLPTTKSKDIDALRVSLTAAEAVADLKGSDVIALDDALKSLAEFDARKSRIVELRFFGGLTEEVTAEAMQIPLRTVQREWQIARAWLFKEMGPSIDCSDHVR